MKLREQFSSWYQGGGRPKIYFPHCNRSIKLEILIFSAAFQRDAIITHKSVKLEALTLEKYFCRVLRKQQTRCKQLENEQYCPGRTAAPAWRLQARPHPAVQRPGCSGKSLLLTKLSIDKEICHRSTEIICIFNYVYLVLITIRIDQFFDYYFVQIKAQRADEFP